MLNSEAALTEKGLPPTLNVHISPDRSDSALHAEDVSVNPPPDGGYGWIMVVAILFLNSVTWGITVHSQV